MKILTGILVIALSLFSFISNGQTGWRTGEMEANVYLHSIEDATTLKNLKLMDEPAYSNGVAMAWVYLTPEELPRLEASGLEFIITNPDLNAHSKNFWDQAVLESYHNFSQLTALADSLDANFPNICNKIILGTSLEGRELAVLKISDNVDVDENEAEVLFDGGIHGNEIMGPELCIRYARELCLGYGNNTTYTDLINNREIWLYYIVNPDGFVNGSRYNSNYVDLNRDIGFMWGGEGYSTAPFSQLETQILRDMWLDNSFVLYNNFHGGTEAISLPWSYRMEAPPDWDQINNLAGAYADASGYNNLEYDQGCVFMYQIFGATKDFNYGSLGQVGWSMEISNDKTPPASMIQMYIDYNIPAMTEVIERIGWGVEGVITDSVTGSPVRGAVFVNAYYPVFTDPIVGDYHKYVLPGTYSITVKASGYETKTITGITVPSEGSIVTNFELAPAEGRYALRALSTEIPYYPNKPTPYLDECWVAGLIGPPDSINYSIGRAGILVVDMGDTIYDGTGDDFKIFEGDTSPEGYTVHVGQDPEGPWSGLGDATGTTGFNLADASVTSARYIKITDDGGGTTNIDNAGFDLDAIQLLTPPLIADFVASNNTPCQGSGVNFTDETTGNPTNWLWLFPGGTPATSTLQNPTNIIYATSGFYDVTLIVMNAYTQVNFTKEDFINVSGMPVAPGNPTGAAVVCQNVQTDYTTSGSPGATSFNWVLTPPEAGTVTGVWVTCTIDWNVTFTGDAYLKVSEVNGCGESPFSDSIPITVVAAPAVFLGTDTLICPQDIMVLDAENPGCTYLWSTGETTQTITVDSISLGLGVHPIWVTATNTLNCPDTDTIIITIDACTAIQEVESASVLIYPNPNTGSFKVAFNGLRNGFCELLNFQGVVVYESTLKSQQGEIEISCPQLAKGIYVLRIRAEGETIIKKVIIQ